MRARPAQQHREFAGKAVQREERACCLPSAAANPSFLLQGYASL
jgi:hypothetical protein